jgi:hypothetical protein
MKPGYQLITLVALALLAGVAAGAGAEPVSGLGTAPYFTLYEAINADTLRLSDYLEHPVLLFFLDCGNVEDARCFPYVRLWDLRYRGDGLRTIGIHCPVFEPLKVYRNALTVVAHADIGLPVGIDTDREVYREYQIDSLPTFLVLKPGGEIAFRTTGTRDFRAVEEAIQQILRERKPDTILPFLLEPLQPIDDPSVEILEPTPMVLPGYVSGTFADCDSADFGKYVTYTDSNERQKGVIYLQGRWKVDEHTISHEQDVFSLDDYIRLVYSGKDVWVLSSFEYGKSPKVYIKHDRSFLPNELWGRDVLADKKGRPYIQPRNDVPVHVVKNHGFGAHELRLIPTQGDFTLVYLYFEPAVDPKSEHSQ